MYLNKHDSKYYTSVGVRDTVIAKLIWKDNFPDVASGMPRYTVQLCSR